MLEINNTTRQKINFKKIREIAEKFLRAYKKSDREVSLAVVGAAKMKSLNKIYRGINKTTDVLSFSDTTRQLAGVGRARAKSSGKFLGEIIINISETKKLGKYQEMFKELEIRGSNKIKRSTYLFYFLFIHGLLHLVGYDDATEDGRSDMLKLGYFFVNPPGKMV